MKKILVCFLHNVIFTSFMCTYGAASSGGKYVVASKNTSQIYASVHGASGKMKSIKCVGTSDDEFAISGAQTGDIVNIMCFDESLKPTQECLVYGAKIFN